LSPWLSDPFQYTGGWFAISFLLQGGFGALLAQRWTRNPAPILATAALFLYAPILLNRLPHATLTAHWLILASLWLYFRQQPRSALAAEAWPWWLLAAISALVMPYLAMMVFAVFAAYWSRRVWVDHERRVTEALFAAAIAMALMAALWWLSGALIVHYRDGGGGVVYGLYSFNLLGFVNSFGMSRLLPMLPIAATQQGEGFAYLGLGMLSLLAVLAIETVWQRRRPHWPKRHWPLVAVTLVLVAYAASTVLTLGSWKLIDFPVASPLLSTFRSSGRFVWIAYYLAMLAAVVLAIERFPKLASGLLLATLALQIWDLAPGRVFFANLRNGQGWPQAEHPLADPRWDQLAAGRHHLTLVPPAACGVPPGSYLPFQLLAAKHAMSLNTAYVARWDPTANGRYCAQLVEQLANGRLSTDDLYVVTDEWRERFEHGGQSLLCESLDGFRACVLD
ncbi:MAG TPA: DUF6311 domain-containing protein, partial [Rudaea sp.]|nr:DUF6311 domain-containing protein [Rudaea sp.]